MLSNIYSSIRRGFTINFVGSAGLTIFRFISISICTYLFGLDGYGEYIFSLTIIYFFSLIIINGMNTSFIKFIHNTNSQLLLFYCIKKIFLRTIATIPFIIILGIVLQYYLEKPNTLTFLLVLTIATGFDNISNMIVALNKFKLVMIEQHFYLFFKETCFILAMLLTLALFGDYALVISSGIASFMGLTFLFLRSLLRYPQYFSVKWNFQPDYEFDTTSKTLMYNSLVNRSIGNSDILLMGFMLPPNLLGVYAILIKLSAVLNLFQKSARTILYPIYTKLYVQHNITEIKKIFVRSSFVIFFITCITALMMLYISNNLFTYFSMPNNGSYQTIFLLLLCAKIIFSASGSSGSLLITFGHSKSFLYSDLVAFSGLIISLLIMVPFAQLTGAAVAVLLSNTIVTGMRFYYVKKYIYKFRK